MSFLWKASPELNYSFICGMYGGGSVLAFLLYALIPSSPEDHFKEESWQRDVSDTLQGTYLIFIPFIPCFLWSLYMKFVASAAGSTIIQEEDKKQKEE
mmetsp:Transcript_21262/g.32545  ORF Transcript_21262/g.32545 Transcript_21262/m.32545 type:complete len:98 (+) Transcript_21262:95-388(+)